MGRASKQAKPQPSVASSTGEPAMPKPSLPVEASLGLGDDPCVKGWWNLCTKNSTDVGLLAGPLLMFVSGTRILWD